MYMYLYVQETYTHTWYKYIQYTSIYIVHILEFPLTVQRTDVNNYYYYLHSYQRNRGKQKLNGLFQVQILIGCRAGIKPRQFKSRAFALNHFFDAVTLLCH